MRGTWHTDDDVLADDYAPPPPRRGGPAGWGCAVLLVLICASLFGAYWWIDGKPTGPPTSRVPFAPFPSTPPEPTLIPPETMTPAPTTSPNPTGSTLVLATPAPDAPQPPPAGLPAAGGYSWAYPTLSPAAQQQWCGTVNVMALDATLDNNTAAAFRQQGNPEADYYAQAAGYWATIEGWTSSVCTAGAALDAPTCSQAIAWLTFGESTHLADTDPNHADWNATWESNYSATIAAWREVCGA